jgi:hypothetical protein
MHVPVLNGHPGVNTDETDLFGMDILSARNRYFCPKACPNPLKATTFEGQ